MSTRQANSSCLTIIPRYLDGIRVAAILLMVFSSLTCTQAAIPTLNEVIVTSKRLPGSILSSNQIAGHVTIIESSEIQNSGQTNVAEILQTRAGIRNMDSLGFGLEGRVSIRGFDGEGKSVLVLVDGVKVSEPYDNTLSWKLIPLEAIERIEILRGGTTALYGEGSIGGVINIILKKGTPKPQNLVSVEGGGYNWGKISVSGSGPFPSNPANQYFYNISRETLGGYRQNGSYNGTNLFTKFNSTIDVTSDLMFSVQVHDDRTGIAGNMTAAEFASNPTLQYSSSGFSLGDHFENRLVQINTVYQKQHSNQFKQTYTVYARSRKNDTYSSFPQYISADSIGLVSQSEWRNLWGADTFVAGGEFSQEKSLSVGSFSTDGIKRDTTALFLSSDYSLDRDLWLNWGLRGDFIAWNISSTSTSLTNRQASAVSPKLSLTKTLYENSKAYVAAYQTFRGPEANTFFFAPTGFLANLNIQPETAKTYEAGVKFQSSNMPELALNFFHTDIDKEILFDNITFTNQNFNSFHEGIELVSKPNLADQWSWGLEVNWLTAKFVGGSYNQKTIPLAPAQNRILSMHYRLSPQSHLSLLWNRVTDQYVLNDFNNVFPTESFETLDAKCDYRMGDFLAYVTVKNINETKYSAYSTSNGTSTQKFNPGAGRHLLIGFSQTF